MESDPLIDPRPDSYPILDRAILDTTGEYPVVYSAVYRPGDPQPLTVARIDLTQPGEDIPVTRPTTPSSTAFTLTHDGVVPQQLTVNATTHGADAHGFAVIGLTGIGTQLPSWPVTMGEIPDGGVWLMVACPTDTTLAYIDGPIGVGR